MYALIRPLLWALEPETAHGLALAALRLMPARALPPDCSDPVTVFGLSFPNRLGLAAGFDKDAMAPGGTLGLGFGFVEIGTVTPRPQPGNPRPRLFRDASQAAVLNRMGFPGRGMDFVRRRLERFRQNHPAAIVGVNIGKNKDQEDATADYVAGVQGFEGLASYLAVNISSPNTPGLRGLQDIGALSRLLDGVLRARKGRTPVLVKLAPDLDEESRAGIAEVLLDFGVDGAIVSNTTVSRPGGIFAGQAGGLSGRPLFDLSTEALASFYKLTGGKLPLIGVGGVEDAAGARAKLAAGASLVQFYSALVFKGPGLVRDIARGLVNEGKKG